ncbi:universal stress protein [Rhodobacterales bacterium HKCCE2091]|nr:universal stress protein [Rhodobacterales bacterium HKCCE2091]
MPSTILVASDLSIRSERALRRAFRLAEAHGAALTVLSVVDEDLPERVATGLAAEAREELGTLAASISDHAVEIRVELGEPVRNIAAAAADTAADLVVLGVHRPRPFWDTFTGTTMERIVRAVPMPVLLAADAVDHDYRTLLAGIDLSPACAAAIVAGADLAPQAKIETFHAFHVPFRGFIAPDGSAEAVAPFRKEAVRDLDTWWDSADLPAAAAKPVPEDDSPTRLLVRKLAEVEPDLLLIGAHGRPALAPMVLGSFTETLLRDPPCDILVARR